MKKRKCLCCREMFVPDKRNYWKQEYCFKPECRKESKKRSNKKWLDKPENKNLFRGSENVQRVQEWRAKNPGYWKRPKKEIALQDVVNSQPIAQELDAKTTPIMKSFALQDFMNLQIPLLIGFISQLTGSALQDVIATVMEKMIQRGTEILNPKIP
ncbi:MAG: hypothetical protein ACD_79C01303G0004 [uncultured bacterium]|nr:MAG: hypothetical protein ACD_79C01303G0004 [uncultured bacterium]